jgi:hypothetical protein
MCPEATHEERTMDPVQRLTEEQLAAQPAPATSEVLEAARGMTPATALTELLEGLPPLPSPEVAMLGDYDHGLAVCRQHAQRLVLRAWLAVAAPETSTRHSGHHG